MGREVIDGLCFLASLPLAGTGQREGGEFSCINKRINSHPVSAIALLFLPWVAFLPSWAYVPG